MKRRSKDSRAPSSKARGDRKGKAAGRNAAADKSEIPFTDWVERIARDKPEFSLSDWVEWLEEGIRRRLNEYEGTARRFEGERNAERDGDQQDAQYVREFRVSDHMPLLLQALKAPPLSAEQKEKLDRLEHECAERAAQGETNPMHVEEFFGWMGDLELLARALASPRPSLSAEQKEEVRRIADELDHEYSEGALRSAELQDIKYSDDPLAFDRIYFRDLVETGKLANHLAYCQQAVLRIPALAARVQDRWLLPSEAEAALIRPGNGLPAGARKALGIIVRDMDPLLRRLGAEADAEDERPGVARSETDARAPRAAGQGAAGETNAESEGDGEDDEYDRFVDKSPTEQIPPVPRMRLLHGMPEDLLIPPSSRAGTPPLTEASRTYFTFLALYLTYDLMVQWPWPNAMGLGEAVAAVPGAPNEGDAEAGTETIGAGPNAASEGNDRKPASADDASDDTATPEALSDDAPVSPAKRKSPTKRAIQCYRLCLVCEISQTEAARMLSKEWGRPVSQGQVSRWCKQVTQFVEEGGILPHPKPALPSKSPQIRSVDSATLDYQNKPDGRFRPPQSSLQHGDD